MGKSALLKELQDRIQMAMLRFAGHNINNPTINEVVRNVQAMSGVAETLNEQAIKETLAAMNDSSVEKMLTITSVSTKPEARSKTISEILFATTFSRLDEIETQCQNARKVLTHAVMYMMLSIWGDDSANINWSAFTKMAAEVIKDNAVRKATDERRPQNGLPGI